MIIQYNEVLKKALLEEMQRVSQGYRLPNPPWEWATNESKEYHKSMYRVLELMVHCPISISAEVTDEK